MLGDHANRALHPSRYTSCEEVYQDKLSNAQLAAGYLPWTDIFDLDEFYQYPVAQSALKKTAHGWTLNKLKRTLIRKHKPSHQK